MSEKISMVRRLRLEANGLGEFQTYASRDYRRMLLDAADEIERLQNQIKSWEERFNEVCKERDEFWDMFDKARVERDEARREVCQMKGTVRWNHYFPHFDPKGYAENRGWDCHKDYK